MENPDYVELARAVKDWGQSLGFQQVGITDTDLSSHDRRLQTWLANGYGADMDYMERHGEKRSKPEGLIPGTIRIISVRMDYLPENDDIFENLIATSKAYVARYALGRDYHKVIRARLRKLEQKINQYLLDREMTEFSARVFTDSAPVLEKGIAEKAGLGWIGKNTLIINERAGSWFFLGEIYTNIPLPEDQTTAVNRCGSCSSCIDICPTGAIVAPYQLDSRLCISYHTIENRGVIPVPIREQMGNRIFGCDDCQAVCPWNRYAAPTAEPDFKPRNNLDTDTLLSLYLWSEQEFDTRSQGSAIRRTGFEGWLRNISIALGNAPFDTKIIRALKDKQEVATDLVKIHVDWAIEQQEAKRKLQI